jgi:hypothetical protein
MGQRRPEIHDRAFIQGVKPGTIRAGCDIGFATPHKYIWEPCPRCDRPRWVPLYRRGRWCASCTARKATRVLRIRDASPKVIERRRHLYALGKAAEAAGLSVEQLQAMVMGAA